MFNHLPLFLIAAGFFILLYGEWKLKLPFKNLGLILLVLAALSAVPTQLSGEGAEELVEQAGVVDGITDGLIEKHETLGFFSAILAYVLGVLSLISLMMLHNTHGVFSAIRKIIILGAGGGMILLALTAHSGGEIRHTEIRFGNGPADQIQQDADRDRDRDYDDD